MFGFDFCELLCWKRSEAYFLLFFFCFFVFFFFLICVFCLSVNFSFCLFFCPVFDAIRGAVSSGGWRQIMAFIKQNHIDDIATLAAILEVEDRPTPTEAFKEDLQNLSRSDRGKFWVALKQVLYPPQQGNIFLS